MQDILVDFGWFALFLVIGFYVRKKITIFQKLYIPAAVIAGTIGLLVGPNVLGLVSPVYVHYSEGVATYPTILLAFVFTTICVGAKFNKDLIKNGFSFFMLTSILLISQIIFAFLLVKIFNLLGSNLELGFTMLPVTGFYGGHGLGAMIVAAYESIGYWDGNTVMSISTTFATIGLLYGIIGGIIFINIFNRKGKMAHASTIDNMSEEELTGYVKPENRKHIILGVSASSLNPLALQFAACLIIFLFGDLLVLFCSNFPYLSNLNILACVAILAVIAAIVLHKTPVGDIFDPDSMKHVTSTAMEFLIVAAIASTNLSVVITYGKEIIVFSLIILFLTTVMSFKLSDIFFKKDSAEHGITAFGIASGVLATGLLLLHIADPENKSSVMTSFPLAALTSIVTQTICMTVVPVTLITGTGTTMIALTVTCVIMITLGIMVGKSKG